MKPDPIERVFGRSRLRMVTGDHVEVFREAIGPGERRRYTKRFLDTGDADFRQWTEREWRILARLIGHGIRCVPDVVHFDGGAHGGMRQVQTYDAGVTVDQWATLLPVAREGVVRRHVFQDCAHWWALAHRCLAALDEIHALQLVHLDIKADNICVPYAPADFDPAAEDAQIHPAFERLALIDFAFSLVSREKLATALPIGWQRDYDYQSPRLLRALEAGRAGDLRPTQELDWRCDLYSLAAMLRRYLPDDEWARGEGTNAGWTPRRYDDARALVYRLRECHDRDFTHWRPHQELMEATDAHLAAPDLARSLQRGWTLVRDASAIVAPALATPVTRIAARRRVAHAGGGSTADVAVPITAIQSPIAAPAVTRKPRASVYLSPLAPVTPVAPGRVRRVSRNAIHASLLAAIAALAAPSFVGDPAHPLADSARDLAAAVVARFDPASPRDGSAVDERDAQPAGGANDAAATTPPDPARSAQQFAPAEPPPGAPAGEQIVAPQQEDIAAQHAPAVAASADTDAASTPPAPAPAPVTQAEAPPASVASGSANALPAPAPRVAQAPAAAPDAIAPRAALTVHNAPAAPKTAPSRSRAAASIAPTSPPHRAMPPTIAQAGKRTGVASVAAAPQRSMPNAASAPAARAGTSTTQRAALGHAVPPSRSTQVPVASPSLAAAPHAAAAPTPAPLPYVPAPLAAAPATIAAAPVVPQPSSVASQPADRAAAASVAPRTPSAPASVADAARSGATVTPERPAIVANREPWQAGLHDVLQALGVITHRAAPVEERDVPRAARPAAPAPVAKAEPRAPETRTALAATDRIASDPVHTAPAMPPVQVQDWHPSRQPTIVARSLDAAAPADAPRAALAPAVYDDRGGDARRMLAEALPRVAAQAQLDAAHALAVASGAEYSTQDRAVVEAAAAPWRSEQAYVPGVSSLGRSRRLYDDARQAMASGRDADAVEIGWRAFAANPRDADIAGWLAYVQLRAYPAQADTARQLALHALAFSGSRRGTRVDQWTTLAAANALTGRETDAARALFVALAVSTNVDYACRAALAAYATFGEAMRPPVMAMLQRLRMQRRDVEAPSCVWPSYTVARRSR